MIDLIMAVLGLMMVGAAIFALYSRDVVSAIVSAGVVSLLASVVYLLVGAPDVAMTEAAIGSALSTVIFLFAWSRIRRMREAGAGSGLASGEVVHRRPSDADDLEEGPRVPGGGTAGVGGHHG